MKVGFMKALDCSVGCIKVLSGHVGIFSDSTEQLIIFLL
jgi:hypothetical protein